jgi:predicted RNase H-like HicB family nuclease
MMPKYELVMWWSNDDNAYLIEVPELPGCMADGGTYEEALANVQVREWIETAQSLGREVPEPRGRLLYA